MASGQMQKPLNLTKRIIDGDVDHNDDTFRLVYVTADPTAALQVSDLWSAISATEVPDGDGYSTHGFSLTTSTSTTAGESKFTSTGSQVLTATGDITLTWGIIVDTSITGDVAEADPNDIVVGFFEIEQGMTITLHSGDTLTCTLSDMYTIT